MESFRWRLDSSCRMRAENDNEEEDMSGCHDMKKGQVYSCVNCGLELEVLLECTECGDHDTCCNDPCSFECCGMPLTLKS